MLNQQGGAARISESGDAPLELNAASHEVRNKARFEPHELDTGKDEPAGNEQTEQLDDNQSQAVCRLPIRLYRWPVHDPPP
jgi:hypothetical protein